MSNGWVGVDFDGTLAFYEKGDYKKDCLGHPIPTMQRRVKRWLAEGREVRIVTARVSEPARAASERFRIEKWCQEHIGAILPVTASKDYDMIELWDDRAVQVESNTGVVLGKPRVP